MSPSGSVFPIRRRGLFVERLAISGATRRRRLFKLPVLASRPPFFALRVGGHAVHGELKSHPAKRDGSRTDFPTSKRWQAIAGRNIMTC